MNHKENSLQSYRENFRKEIVPTCYNAKLHIIFLVTVVAAFFILALAQVDYFSLSGILVFILIICYSNLHVYIVHRFFLHRKIWGFVWAFDMHVIHHKLYTRERLEFEELNDLYMLLMPPKILFMYYFVYCPLVLSVLYMLLPAHLFWYSALGLSLWFGYYEFIHFIQHMPKNHFIMKFPYCYFLRKFHEVHHDQSLMNKKNFDIAIPMYDYLFKTFEK